MDGKSLLTLWQQRLGLQDWRIDLRDNAIPSDFVLENVAGECEWNEVNKAAVIRIINPICYGDRIIPFDYEKTLVHELLHIKFCLLDNSGNALQDRIVHQLIDEFAVIFVREARVNK